MNGMIGFCVYCGKKTGIFRTHHPECKERNGRVAELIPQIFLKAIGSTMDSERFAELLLSAGEAANMPPGQFRSACNAGMLSVFDGILQDRLINRAEEERIAELIRSTGNYFLDTGYFEAKLAKVGILRALRNRLAPDRVAIDPDLPIELRRGEIVLWIFNHATSASKIDLPSDIERPLIVLSGEIDPYYGTKAFQIRRPTARDVNVEKNGDLVLTNYNLYFLHAPSAPQRVPIARIAALEPFSDGVYVAWGAAKRMSRSFTVDDPWFITNAIAQLIQAMRS